MAELQTKVNDRVIKFLEVGRSALLHTGASDADQEHNIAVLKQCAVDAFAFRDSFAFYEEEPLLEPVTQAMACLAESMKAANELLSWQVDMMLKRDLNDALTRFVVALIEFGRFLKSPGELQRQQDALALLQEREQAWAVENEKTRLEQDALAAEELRLQEEERARTVLEEAEARRQQELIEKQELERELALERERKAKAIAASLEAAVNGTKPAAATPSAAPAVVAAPIPPSAVAAANAAVEASNNKPKLVIAVPAKPAAAPVPAPFAGAPLATTAPAAGSAADDELAKKSKLQIKVKLPFARNRTPTKNDLSRNEGGNEKSLSTMEMLDSMMGSLSTSEQMSLQHQQQLQQQLQMMQQQHNQQPQQQQQQPYQSVTGATMIPPARTSMPTASPYGQLTKPQQQQQQQQQQYLPPARAPMSKESPYGSTYNVQANRDSAALAAAGAASGGGGGGRAESPYGSYYNVMQQQQRGTSGTAESPYGAVVTVGTGNSGNNTYGSATAALNAAGAGGGGGKGAYFKLDALLAAAEAQQKEQERLWQQTPAVLADSLSNNSVVASVGYASDRNAKHRKTMEDEHVVLPVWNGKPSQAFIAVYDGHGGRRAVEYVSQYFHGELYGAMKDGSNRELDLAQAIERVDTALCETLAAEQDASGCTAAIAVVERDASGKRRVTTANIGDARVVVSEARGTRGRRLTVDHKADDPAEVSRIEAAGGAVFGGKISGVLAVARAFGDHEFKPNLWVSRKPSTMTTTVDDGEFLIVACDGLFDVCTDDEVVTAVSGIRDPTAMAETLVKRALDKGTTDNISVVCVRF